MLPRCIYYSKMLPRWCSSIPIHTKNHCSCQNKHECQFWEMTKSSMSKLYVSAKYVIRAIQLFYSLYHMASFDVETIDMCTLWSHGLPESSLHKPAETETITVADRRIGDSTICSAIFVPRIAHDPRALALAAVLCLSIDWWSMIVYRGMFF